MRDEARQSALTQKILEMLADQPVILLDQLFDGCPGATWNEVFVAVDNLSRTSGIRLTGKGMGRYQLELLVNQHRLESHN